MAAKVNIAGHPVHPMLVAFPIGLWVFSLACDILFRATGNQVWDTVALYSMGGGIIGAIAAALPGFFDLLDMQESDAKRIGMGHALLNMGALLILFVAAFPYVRAPARAPCPSSCPSWASSSSSSRDGWEAQWCTCTGRQWSSNPGTRSGSRRRSGRKRRKRRIGSQSRSINCERIQSDACTGCAQRAVGFRNLNFSSRVNILWTFPVAPS